MRISVGELREVIKTNWGMELDSEYLKRLLQMMQEDEKIACVIDSIGDESRSFKGYVFCMSNRIIVLGKKQEESISLSSIRDIKLSRGVAYTLTSSELVLKYDTGEIFITSCRHDMIENFKNILQTKIGSDGRFSTVVHEKSSGEAVLKMIFSMIAFIVILYILSVVGASME